LIRRSRCASSKQKSQSQGTSRKSQIESQLVGTDPLVPSPQSPLEIKVNFIGPVFANTGLGRHVATAEGKIRVPRAGSIAARC